MIRVLSAGPLTTVQDAGRYGWAHVGVPAAGPADHLAHAMANRLAGNRDGAAALECTLTGPLLRFERPASIAVVGAALHIDGEPAEPGRRIDVQPGQTVRIDAAERARSYLAVAGGILALPVLGSLATDTLSGLGPAPLVDGDALAIGTLRTRPRTARAIEYGQTLRVLPGPRADWFAEPLPRTGYTVGPRSDRTGLRLTGPPIARCETRELPTEGMVTGAIQVPTDGLPIVLLPNHAVTGGYPVIAVVISADVHRLGQLPPGTPVEFVPVDSATAREEYRKLLQRYGSPNR